MAMTSNRGTLGCLLAVAVLAGGCGTGADDPVVTALGVVTNSVTRNFGDEGVSAPRLTAETLPPALVAQIDGPLILVETPQLGGSTLMTRVGQNGSDSTWRGPEGFGLTLGAGNVLRSTRGLGFDLMASDASAVASGLAARRAGPVPRVEVRLDGEGQQLRASLSCTLALDGPDTVTIASATRSLTRMTETCQSASGSHQNIYWLDGSGRAVQSEQWIGGTVGMLRVTEIQG